MTAKENADYLLKYAQDRGITNPRELANFMGQMQVECGGYGRMEENLGYSAEGLLKTFPGRNGMNTLEDAKHVTEGGRAAIAEKIYGGAWGSRNLGNTEPGDGMRFHGRGYVQLTGRENYQRVGDALGIDLVGHPEKASDRETAAKIAVYYWESKVRKNGDQLDVTGACHDINGGENGLPARKVATREWEKLLDRGYQPGSDDPIAFLSQGGHHGKPTSEDVRLAQTRLNQMGYGDAHGKPLQEDGVMGKQTRSAIEAFQRDHHLKADGIVGPETLRHLNEASRMPTAPRLDHTAHPAHGLFNQAQDAVRHLDREHGRSFDEQSLRLAGAATVEASRQGMTGIDRIVMNTDASTAYAVKGDIHSPLKQVAEVDMRTALTTPLEKSSEAAMRHSATLIEPQAQVQQQQPRLV